MQNVLARIISILFHPLLMATYLCGILMTLLPSALDPIRREVFSGLLILIFLVTFVLPALNILIFKVFGSISSLSMEDRQDRILPFVFISLLYLLMTFLFYNNFKIDFSQNILKFLIIMDLLVIGATVITFFYKVSIHSIGICGLLGILVPLNKVSEGGSLLYITVAAIVVAGLVMSSRLQLNAHTPREVMTGGVMGFTISFLSMIVMF